MINTWIKFVDTNLLWLNKLQVKVVYAVFADRMQTQQKIYSSVTTLRIQ
ncbi:protein of unknown function [Candidatus Nitrosocosmicus franklandus]|uniref:Uncharacterized protein n=1 Tax=Candidatus Nitrosocosmicus franklandianus TaxID=1798806 RepID=A0A484I6W8_9ARCH|nr:protein of unknown function [Candidatus Nitrosocosmicus franklandus]